MYISWWQTMTGRHILGSKCIEFPELRLVVPYWQRKETKILYWSILDECTNFYTILPLTWRFDVKKKTSKRIIKDIIIISKCELKLKLMDFNIQLLIEVCWEKSNDTL